MFGKWCLMMVHLVTWGWRRCWRGKSWVRTDNQSQSSLHHITAFPPPRSSHLLRPSSNHRKSTLAGPPRPEVQAERDTGAQVGVTRGWGEEVEISSWHHHQHHHPPHLGSLLEYKHQTDQWEKIITSLLIHWYKQVKVFQRHILFF